LRWDSVFQRPHHLLSRLARTHPVYLVEEPVAGDAETPSLVVKQVAPNITVCQPRVKTRWGYFASDAAPQYERLVRRLMAQEGLSSYVFWYYTPLALHFTRSFAPCAVVYDCMDELANFRHAPRELRAMEAELMRRADLVFTGGPSLYEARRDRHPSVHLFPSSVDTAHFACAATGAVAPHPRTAELPAPRLGFYGVIDERLDLALLDGLAAARPEWQIVMVGPVAKIDQADLPRHPNLHYFGRADYKELPAHLAGWGVAVMPFALNEATRFISPTKTLEYMAAARPIVSTPIRDVAQSYGQIIAIADDVPSFVAACEQALTEDEIRRRRRLVAYSRVLQRTSWDQTVASMQSLLRQCLRAPAPVPVTDPALLDSAV
jgi:UDP-galactopyranose mutase